MHSASNNCPNARPPYESAHRPGSLLHLAVLYMQTPLANCEHVAHCQQQPRGRGSRRKPCHLLEWGTARGLSCSQPANARCMHAPRLYPDCFGGYGLEERRGEQSQRWPRVTARLASLCMATCSGSSDAGSLLCLQNYSTHTCRRRSAHLTGRSRELYRLVTRRCILPHHGSLRSETGCLRSQHQCHKAECQNVSDRRTPGPPSTQHCRRRSLEVQARVHRLREASH